MMRGVIGVYFGVVVTPWKLVGFLGALMFAGRWLVQAWATQSRGSADRSRAASGSSVSLGSAMVTSYFIWGKNDAVGVLTNLLPASVAFYNLVMDIKCRPHEFQCLTSVCSRARAAPSPLPYCQPNRPAPTARPAEPFAMPVAGAIAAIVQRRSRVRSLAAGCSLAPTDGVAPRAPGDARSRRTAACSPPAAPPPIRWSDLLWLALALLIIIGTGLGIRDPWPADEPRFAALARDMVAIGRVAVSARRRRSVPGQAAAVLLAAGGLLFADRFDQMVVPDPVVSRRRAACCS